MNRLMQWVIAAALICGASVFTSCTKQDNPVNPADNLAEKIIGKWIFADIDGKPALTNEKAVTTFVSATKAIDSESKVDFTPTLQKWHSNVEFEVQINGNKMILTTHRNDSITLVKEHNVIAINDIEMFSSFKHTTFCYGKPIVVREQEIHYKKINRDYKEAVLGTWEGHVTNSEGSVYDDGETHRWEYKADGTYVYYEKDGDDWVPYKGNTLNEYFVDGVLLCTRWIDNDVENREWWEIASIKDGVMKWKALRQKEDGSTYTATFEMKKVE